MQCATQQGISQTCSSVRVVAYITMLPVWKLGPHLSNVQVGNVLSVKCARLAGKIHINDLYMCAYPFYIGQIKPNNSVSFRQPGEDSKMLVCDACDKGYHTFCLQPAMESLPSDPWKCRVSQVYYFNLYKSLCLHLKLVMLSKFVFY